MPRKSKSTAAKTVSKRQPKKQVQRQSTEFGELDTTPTSHHDGSPVSSTEQKSHSSGSDAHRDGKIIGQDEFDDGIDDNDLAELADTQDDSNTPGDRKIAWSERGSGTHRSSSMSSQEEEQSVHVFGYIGEIPTLSSPASGHDALPDTLPLPTATGVIPLLDGQIRSSLLVDFSETASTIFRSSPLGRSHAFRKSGTASRPNSIHENTEFNHNDTQLLETEVLGDDIPHTSSYNQDVSKSKILTQDAANSAVTEANANPASESRSVYNSSNVEPEARQTPSPLAAQNIALDDSSGLLDEYREFEAENTPDNIERKVKRKQWPKTPLQFDEDTQEVKSASQRLPHSHVNRQHVTGSKVNANNRGKKEGKKRKLKNSDDDKPRKKLKSATKVSGQSIDDATMLDIGKAISLVSQSPTEDQAHVQALNSSAGKEISNSELDINQEPSEAECEDENENITVETVPGSMQASQMPEKSNDEPAEKTGDCIFVAQDEIRSGMDNEIYNQGPSHSATHNIFDENNWPIDIDGDTEFHSTENNNGGVESNNKEDAINSSVSKVVHIRTPRRPDVPRSTAKGAPGRRTSLNFSVSEKGSPIPRQQKDSKIDLAAAKSSSIAALAGDVPGVYYETHTTQTSGYSFNGRSKEPTHERPRSSAKQKPESMPIPIFAQNDFNIKSRPSLISELQQEQKTRRGINKSQHKVPYISAADNSRQQLHDLVDVRSLVES